MPRREQKSLTGPNTGQMQAVPSKRIATLGFDRHLPMGTRRATPRTLCSLAGLPASAPVRPHPPLPRPGIDIGPVLQDAVSEAVAEAHIPPDPITVAYQAGVPVSL